MSIMAAKHMSAAEVEPISPELVLVCPELREEAIGALPDPVWRAFVVDVQTRTATDLVDRQPQSLLSAVSGALRDLLVPALAFLALVVVVTTVLTFVADAVR